MHRSQLGGFIIDCQTDDIQPAASFWGDALGMKTGPGSEPGQAGYAGYVRPHNGLNIEVQAVAHESRVHLDIETDDIPAEVTRLERLGAKRIKTVRDWVVMEAPTGQRFCIVPAFRENFLKEANIWE